ncbi:uncharacterized protein E0L32_001172 [Thyridium curvatum]|uniref:Major facilitator superfamily (MFS) profile domain-containing protein n=1 Tax=Thyridium curvatum TaxID=1093900 RepID=A0A507AY32_9PEZI|nr:uncharacterized protein E0L32_001172 [Thyridium curvatum]TPX11354.1 hypothetical protein E0L32_001172 [Thyridium curvatum]
MATRSISQPADMGTDPPSNSMTSVNSRSVAEPEGNAGAIDKKRQTDDGAEKAAAEEEPVNYPTGFRLTCIILALVLGIFLASLDMTIVATAIPKITDEFQGLDKASWYGAAFFMANGGFQSSWGKAYRYFPLKFTFLTSVFVFELGSLICAVAQDSATLIVGRAINGLGAAGLGTGAYTIIAFIAPPAKRAMYTGFVGMSFGVACVAGPLIGGVFAHEVSWRWCFWINLPIGGLAALIILFFFQTPISAKPVSATWRERLLQMDPLGIALVMGSIVCFMLALQQGGQTYPWRSRHIVGLLVGFAALAALFGLWEWRQGERSMIVPRLFGKRPVFVSCLTAMILLGGYYLIIYQLPVYFQSVGNASPTMSGVYNLPLIVATTISMISSGAAISSSGGTLTPYLQSCGAMVATVAAGLLYTLDTDSDTGRWVGFQLLGGIGWGIAFQIPIIATQATVSETPEDVGPATAMVLFFQCIGGAVFVTAAQTAFVNKLTQTLASTLPAVDPAKVVTTGATEIRSVFPAGQVPVIVSSYMAGIKVAIAIAIAGAGLGFLITLFTRWEKPKLSEGHKESMIVAAG